MVLTVSFELSWVTGLVCHHHRRDAEHHRQLDASVGASGPHGFAVRKIGALVFGAACVHRIPSPTSVTIAKRPLCVGQDGDGDRGDLGQKKTGIFLQAGLDSWCGDLPGRRWHSAEQHTPLIWIRAIAALYMLLSKQRSEAVLAERR